MSRLAIESGTTDSAPIGNCKPMISVSASSRGSWKTATASGAAQARNRNRALLTISDRPNTLRCWARSIWVDRTSAAPRPISATRLVKPTNTIAIAIKP